MTGTGKLGRWQDRDFTDLADWYHELGLDRHSVVADPQFVDIDGPDSSLTRQRAISADDDYRVHPGSPTIDAGNPLSSDLLEPAPTAAGSTSATPATPPTRRPAPRSSSRCCRRGSRRSWSAARRSTSPGGRQASSRPADHYSGNVSPTRRSPTTALATRPAPPPTAAATAGTRPTPAARRLGMNGALPFDADGSVRARRRTSTCSCRRLRRLHQRLLVRGVGLPHSVPGSGSSTSGTGRQRQSFLRRGKGLPTTSISTSINGCARRCAGHACGQRDRAEQVAALRRHHDQRSAWSRSTRTAAVIATGTPSVRSNVTRTSNYLGKSTDRAPLAGQSTRPRSTTVALSAGPHPGPLRPPRVRHRDD